MEIDLGNEEKVQINDTGHLFEIMRKILFREEEIGRNREHFWVIGLSEHQVLLYIELVALGNKNMLAVEPREVFQLALQKSSAYVVLVQNKTGDSILPTEEEKDLTDMLLHAAELVKLELTEHLIFNAVACYSFLEENLIEELGKSKKYAVYLIEEMKLLEKGRKEGEKKGIEIGENNKAIEIAKGMKQLKMDTKVISNLLGLSVEEVEKL